MLIPTAAIVGLRCASCGREDEHPLSLFLFNGITSLNITCTCGNPLLTLHHREQRQVSLRLECPECGGHHRFRSVRPHRWRDRRVGWHCPATGGLIGWAEARTEWELPVAAAESPHFFQHRELMCTVLERLCRMVQAGKLSCQCGSPDLDLEILPDRVNIVCESCGAWEVIAAGSEADREEIGQLQQLSLAYVRPAGANDQPRPRKRRNI